MRCDAMRCGRGRREGHQAQLGRRITENLGLLILPPEGTVALISVTVHSGINNDTPTELGGCFVDYVELTVTR